MGFQNKQNDVSTYFGANLQGLNSTDESDVIKNQFQSLYIRHSANNLSTFTSGELTGLRQKYDAGMRIFCNIIWESGGGGRNFPTNLTTYANKLNAFLDDNGLFLKDGMAVIENEEANGVYYNYSTSSGATPPYTTTDDYLAILEVAIDICHSRNIKIADGALHFTYFDDIENGHLSNDAAARGDAFMTGFAGLNLDYVNAHFQVPFSGMSSGDHMIAGVLRHRADYYHDRTGHRVICNEWHQELDSLTNTQQDNLCQSIVDELRQAHLHYCINFGGDGTSDALQLVNNSTLVLTHLGVAYQNAILNYTSLP